MHHTLLKLTHTNTHESTHTQAHTRVHVHTRANAYIRTHVDTHAYTFQNRNCLVIRAFFLVMPIVSFCQDYIIKRKLYIF